MVEREKYDDRSLDDLLTLTFWKGFKESNNFADANIYHSKATNPLYHPRCHSLFLVGISLLGPDQSIIIEIFFHF